MASFARTAQQFTSLSSETLTPDGATDFDGPATLKGGQWIKVTASTVSSISAATNPTTVDMNYLLVGGGGAGGSADDDDSGAGGGGGGGEVVSGSAVAFDVQAYSITVGQGVTGSTSISKRGNATNSTIVEADGTSVDSAEGGDSGGVGVDNVSPTSNYDGNNRTDAGSGGGGAANGNAGTGGVSTNGGDGGDSFDGGASNNSTGGGGGSTANAGTAGTSGQGGVGGDGTASSITGVSVTYGGGGGGGGDNGNGGAGGGGNGQLSGSSGNGDDGTDGLGGGGGGAFSNTDNTSFHHYAMAYNGSSVTIWWDNVKKTTAGSFSDTLDFTGLKLVLGGYYSSSFLLDGSLDEVDIRS